jgi:hypothetical protein
MLMGLFSQLFTNDDLSVGIRAIGFKLKRFKQLEYQIIYLKKLSIGRNRQEPD